jgi:hypothetical protein
MQYLLNDTARGPKSLDGFIPARKDFIFKKSKSLVQQIIVAVTFSHLQVVSKRNEWYYILCGQNQFIPMAESSNKFKGFWISRNISEKKSQLFWGVFFEQGSYFG